MYMYVCVKSYSSRVLPLAPLPRHKQQSHTLISKSLGKTDTDSIKIKSILLLADRQSFLWMISLNNNFQFFMSTSDFCELLLTPAQTENVRYGCTYFRSRNSIIVIHFLFLYRGGNGLRFIHIS